MKPPYRAKYRNIINVETNTERTCWSPEVKKDGKWIYVGDSSKEEIYEFDNEEEAYKMAKETYLKFHKEWV